MRARDRQQLRAEVDAAVADLPLAYVIEAASKRLDVADGFFVIVMREGYLHSVVRHGRHLETQHYPDGEAVDRYGSEVILPVGLWEQPVRVARRRIDR